ncbi:vitamin k-dependent gamma-carboxylase, putative [Pediculus humanus corporis]|uniref:Vitamin K-dependent gamma-carboxylase n=1 Tax=Pediculus humanus subsp. corporis TaxID=121224 RepID=E0VHW0_PEDHC|nr:vitamin k-dependent gamma-carboxylase, putative [Pediculus humanus corporis]EEB12966.1 vitamin k-dependent gamma-carboxylase, putative [Pediculus humanus corporis]
MDSKSNVHFRKFTGSKEKILKNEFETKIIDKKKLFDRIEDYCDLKKLKIYNLNYLINLLYSPTCSSSLGLMMVIDIPDERGLGNIDLRFGDAMKCHFPLFDWLSPLPLEYMGLLYFIMWLGSLGICLGYKFKLSCILFIFPYWYIYLLDKSFWNNHSYLYGLISILFTFTCAHYSFSLDAYLNPSINNEPVPLWNYVIIRFQFFLLYFYAGMKKFDPDWIGGYSMTKLGLHWVFEPFRLVLNNDQIDFWIIHIFGFTFDLTVGFFFLFDKTRPIAIIFSTAFHLLNSCMFHIGQFPYVCLVTTPIFCNYDWPEQLLNHEKYPICMEKVTNKQKFVCFAMSIYIAVQLFLPYSHFLTQGYNNWTNGLYGYSWDMMVQNWNSDAIVIKVVDNESKKEFFIDPEAWVSNTRYSKHGDMLIQYAKCLKKNLNNPNVYTSKDVGVKSFDDISIYVDVWCSLNGRFQQRMFNPNQNLLTAKWNPFEKISWLMPLLTNYSSWRVNLKEIQKQVHGWSNHSEVLFVADFPGMHLENYIEMEFTNVTVTVLEGTITLEQGNNNNTLAKGDFAKINEGTFHKIYTISTVPSCYMYTYNNFSVDTKIDTNLNGTASLGSAILNEIFVENLSIRFEKLFNSFTRLRDCFYKLLFNVPIPIRNKGKR